MTARGTVSPVALVQDGGAATGTLTAANTAGHLIQPGQIGKVLLRVVNGTTAGTMTVRARGNGNNAAGNAQTSPYPSNAVFTQGAVGDLAFTWGTTAGTQI